MGLVQEKGIYFFEEFLEEGAVAGFTDRNLPGLDLEQDLKRISACLDFTYKDFFYLNQVHGNRVVFPDKSSKVFTGDSLISDEKDTALLVKTADCLPIFFYSPGAKVIGLVHLGWRSAKDKILDVFIAKLKNDFSVDLSNCLVGIGPALRACCFEVGKEFLDFDCFQGFIQNRDSKYFLDIVGFLKQSFIAQGLDKDNFLDSGICSICNDNFYSFRREKTNNRTISFIIQK